MPSQEPVASAARLAQVTYRDDRMPDTWQVANFVVTEAEWRRIGEAEDAD